MKIVRRKLVIVGDNGVGKTSLLTVIADRKFPTGYTPIVFGGLVMEEQGNGKIVQIGFWDTANGEDHDRLRPLNYPDSAIVVICFAIDDIKSLQNVAEKWYPEVAHFAPGVPILLLACKTDLRLAREEGAGSSLKQEPDVTREQARAVAGAIGAVRYMECSARMDEGVKEFLQASAKIAASWDLISYRPRHFSCQIL